MKHLVICREYPPALYAGGIGTYVYHLSRLLAERGEIVHVIGQLWRGATKELEVLSDGRLFVHRVPLEDWAFSIGGIRSPAIKSKEGRGLFETSFYPQCFSWQASLLAERLVEQEGIDVIETQEFEAPLYYFQLRRALGFGPKRKPPCIIHLHSPMEFIVRYNDWNICNHYFMTAKRLEDYSIAASDALLCPSRYLARQAEKHYGIVENSIHVIPLPIGNNPLLSRDKDTWETGTICYLGRLERRKGILEWIDAATAVADEYPKVRFEFVGANVLGTVDGEDAAMRRIPDRLKSKFIFRGQQKRSSIPQYLSGARIAVVPSRWENFPNTCVEAMCSGLPVIASREGGMVEMIEDGSTGWLANKTGIDGLADALRRALNTPPANVAEMGYQASLNIRKYCDNEKIVESHLRFRRQIVDQGTNRSLRLPVNLPWAKRPFSDESARRTSENTSKKGLAIVVTGFNKRTSLDECLQSIELQTQKPVMVVIVDNGMDEEQTSKIIERALRNEWRIVQKRNTDIVLAKNAGIEAVLSSGLNPIGFSFLNGSEQLQPDFIAVCEPVLQQCREVGIVSCWSHYSGSENTVWIKPCPSFPHQWISNEAVSYSVIHTEALREAGYFRSVMNLGYEDWDLFNAVMAAGWVAVTIPRILGEHKTREGSLLRTASAHAYGIMRKQILERFPDLIVRDTRDIVLLTESNAIQSLHKMRQTLHNNHRNIVLRSLGKAKRKILRHAPEWLYNSISRITK